MRPDGVSNARSSSRVHGPWHPSPAQAFGLVAAGSTVSQYGTPAEGGLATDKRWRPSCPTAGALAHGARLPVSVPACRWTVISNAFRDPAGKNCVAKCATHFSLIGGKYRSLPREGVALVQAITILPPKGVSPLRDRGRETGRPSGGFDLEHGASKCRSERRLLFQPSPGGVPFGLANPPDRALSPAPPSHGGSYVTPTPWLK